MKLLNKNCFIVSLFHCFIGFFVISVFFYPFLFQGKIPIAADTILGMYHPWRDIVWDGFKSGIPFKNFLITDPVRQQYLWKKLAIDQYKKGEWPLWNPYTHAGMPLLANFQTGAFYPFNIIFFILPFDIAWGTFIFLQFLLGFSFFYLFLKQLKLKPFACSLGGLCFVFSGFFIAWHQWGNIGHTILWLPLNLLAIEKIFENGSMIRIIEPKRAWILFFLISQVASFFAGHLQISFYVILVSISYIIWKIFSSKTEWQQKKKIIFLFSIFYFLFSILTSIQWLPTLELIHHSARVTDQAELIQREGWFFPWQHLVQFFAPDFFGNPATLNYWGVWNYGELVGYIGVIPLFFAFFSFFSSRKQKFFFIFLLLFSLSFALPTPWAKLPFLLKLPFISTAQPTRLLSIVGFCLSVLVGFGIERFLGGIRSKGGIRKLEFFGSLGTFGIIFLGLWNFAMISGNKVALRNLILPSAIFLSFLIFVYASPYLKRVLRSSNALILITIYYLLITTCFDWLRFAFKFSPFVKREWLFPKTKTIEFLEKESLSRFMVTDRRIFPPNFSLAYNLQTIEGYDPLYLKEYASLITEMESGEKDKIAVFNRIIQPANFKSAIADQLNISYVLSLSEIENSKLEKVFQEGETRVYKNKKVQPRVRLLPETEGDWAKIMEYSPNRVVIETEATREKDLILADMFYPGWQAKVNGKKVKVEETEENFRKIKILPGESMVEFFYWPRSFTFGIFLSVSGFIFSIITPIRLIKLNK